jgi:hypothetical protein
VEISKADTFCHSRTLCRSLAHYLSLSLFIHSSHSLEHSSLVTFRYFSFFSLSLPARTSPERTVTGPWLVLASLRAHPDHLSPTPPSYLADEPDHCKVTPKLIVSLLFRISGLVCLTCFRSFDFPRISLNKLLDKRLLSDFGASVRFALSLLLRLVCSHTPCSNTIRGKSPVNRFDKLVRTDKRLHLSFSD